MSHYKITLTHPSYGPGFYVRFQPRKNRDKERLPYNQRRVGLAIYEGHFNPLFSWHGFEHDQMGWEKAIQDFLKVTELPFYYKAWIDFDDGRWCERFRIEMKKED